MIDDVDKREPSYFPALNNNFQELQEEIRELKSLRDEFVREIKDCFELQDIEDYLNSYPRLDFHQDEQVSNDPLASPDAIRMDRRK